MADDPASASLIGNFDASAWASQFVKFIELHPDLAHDEGYMIGWFANALMTGHDHALRELAKELRDTQLAQAVTSDWMVRGMQEQPT